MERELRGDVFFSVSQLRKEQVESVNVGGTNNVIKGKNLWCFCASLSKAGFTHSVINPFNDCWISFAVLAPLL